MRSKVSAAVFVTTLALCACTDPTSPRKTTPSRELRLDGVGSETLGLQSETLDQRFVAVANVINGFGGFFFDENGNPTIYLRDVTVAPAVDGRLRAMLLPEAVSGNARTTSIRYLPAKYDFKELASFRSVAERLLNLERQAVWSDIEEARNRVTIAVRNEAAQQSLKQAIAAAGVPEDAVAVIVDGPMVSVSAPGDSLSSEFRPLPGGVLITDNNGCTSGFGINWNGHPAFVTASHCTDYVASLTNPHSYGNPANLPVIGVEVADPAPWQNTSDCAFSRAFEGVDFCRYSDAAIIQVPDTLPNSTVAVGYIARTQALGSELIDQSNPHWEITAKRPGSYLYVGLVTQRMGIQSHWKQETVTNTCVTQYITVNHNKNAKFWCQLVLSTGSIGGDSGGPVFVREWCGLSQFRPDGTECVSLVGIAQSRNAANNRTYISPISGMDTDFGTSLLILPANQP